MNEIIVVISGIILLVSSNAYLPAGGTAAISSALAVEASTPIDSAYDIDIPVHEALLSLREDDVASFIDPDQRLETHLLEDTDPLTVLPLRGDRIQLGTGGRTCRATAVATATRDSLLTLPRLSAIVSPEVKLRRDSSPDGTDFTRVKKSRVAAWLDIRGGDLRATHDGDRAYEEVEFRPSRHRARVSPQVDWRLTSKEVDCILVTPFDPRDGRPLTIALKPDRDIRIDFHNMADVTTGELVRDIAYDFELFYRVIEPVPAVPPIPYTLDVVEVEARPGDPGPDGLTGVNCGPPRIR